MKPSASFRSVMSLSPPGSSETDPRRNFIETYYQDVTRHTTSEEMRSKLGDELVKRGLAPSLYETEEEAETMILI
jgi:hypothetical protein